MAKKMTRAGKSPCAAPYDDSAWRARDALRTLTRADEIRKDRGLMRQVKAEARTQVKAASRVLGPRKRG